MYTTKPKETVGFMTVFMSFSDQMRTIQLCSSGLPGMGGRETKKVIRHINIVLALRLM
jgi:hypothetical protein